VNYSFLTQKERDIETGLDYFGARYHSSAQGRFTSSDPYNPIVDSEEEEDFAQYLGQPQNWNRCVYVWNNPLRYIDPNGEKVYVVTYTFGNSSGDDEFRRAAETREQQIRNSKGFDPKKDTVLLAGVKTKEDFAKVIKEANGLQKQYGKVEQISLYSHAGSKDGPVFHDQGGNPTQFSQGEISNLRVNWSGSAGARFYGCYTGKNFAQNFANAQRVPAYGYDRYAYFSTSPDKRTSNDTGRLYLIATDGYENGTWLKYMSGNSESYPMVRRNPAPAPKARPRR
jgi:RHS repeat-associated protein